MKDVSYYIENVTQTMNGVVFKDEDAFKRKSNDPCYIGEYYLEDIEQRYKNNPNITVKELIEEGVIETYHTILKQVEDRIEDFRDDEDFGSMSAHEIAEIVFCESDWTCISTTIDQFTY